MDTLEKDAAESSGKTLHQAGQTDADAWKRNVQEQLDKLQDSLAQSQVTMKASWVAASQMRKDWAFISTSNAQALTLSCLTVGCFMALFKCYKLQT